MTFYAISQQTIFTNAADSNWYKMEQFYATQLLVINFESTFILYNYDVFVDKYNIKEDPFIRLMTWDEILEGAIRIYDDGTYDNIDLLQKDENDKYSLPIMNQFDWIFEHNGSQVNEVIYNNGTASITIFRRVETTDANGNVAVEMWYDPSVDFDFTNGTIKIVPRIKGQSFLTPLTFNVVPPPPTGESEFSGCDEFEAIEPVRNV